MSSSTCVTARLRRTMPPSKPSPHCGWATSDRDAEALEPVALDGVRTEEAPALVSVHRRALAQPVSDGTRVGPGAVGVGVVGLEQDVLQADLVAAAQPVHVV